MKHKFLRLCSIVLVLTLICNMLPLQIFAEEFQELLSSDPVQTAPITEGETEALEKGYIIDEVEEKRTEYSKEFRLSSGLSMTAMYPTPVHYLSDGKWEDIDNTLTVSGDSYTNTAGAWELSFPQELTEDERITVSLNGTSLSFGMAGELRESSNVSTYALGRKEHSVHKMTRSHGRPQAQKTPDRDEKYPELTLTKLSSRMEYQNIYGTTDLQYDVNPNQLKESVILESYSSTLLGYQYALETDGLTPVLGEDGGILFTNAEGKVVLSMPAPFLVDNNGVYNYDIQVTLEQTGNSWLLSYRLPGNGWQAQTGHGLWYWTQLSLL